MKKHWLLTLWCLSVISMGYGQHRSIDFREAEWKDVLRQARKEKKVVFADCYTSWCGPCKMMAKNIFTQDSVADFYNRHFVCVKMDMEKEGKPLAEKYKVKSYPTFLFIDAKTGQLIHSVVGYREAASFMAEGEKALDSRNSLAGLEARYEAGERTPEFMTLYLGALKGSGERKKCDERMDAYFKTLTDEQFAIPEHWKLLEGQLDFQTNPFSTTYQRMMTLRKAFYQIAEPEMVDLRLNVVLQNYISRYVRWEADKGRAFDQEGLKAVIAYLQTVDYPRAASWLAQLHTVEYLGKQDYRGMFEDMKQRMTQFNDPSEREYYLLLYLGRLAESKDQDFVREVLEWMKQWEKTSSKTMLYAKAKLLKACGEEAEAQKVEEMIKGGASH